MTKKQGRILVVDDDEQILRLMEAMLIPLHYEVVLARDGMEALDKVREIPPDVILLDIMMPKMNGFEVARRLKEDDGTKIIPIVMMTALGSVADRVKAMEVGADDFLTKPVDKTELRARVSSLLKVKAYNDHMRNYQKELEAEVARETEQLQQAHDRIERAVQGWRTTLDAIGDLVWITDEDCQLVRVNLAYANAVGIEPKQLIGRTCHNVLPWAREICSSCPQKHTIATKESAVEEFHSPQQGVHFEISTSPMFNDEGEVTACVCVAKDITERTQLEQERLAHQRVVQELTLAWQIQSRFLPDELPHVAGWELTATLKPARETSGDFYDVIPLPNGQLGILVADVADKGMGAALYMALSRTLIRTYAAQYDSQPDVVLRAANHRLLADIHVNMFVTVFYGILDPATGMLTYCNAGHNPPYLLSVQNGGAVQVLPKTGMVLGVVEDVDWKQETVQLAPGDVLLLYTDGITEAQNLQEEFFGEKRLLETLQANRVRSAQDIQDALIGEVSKFVGDAPQFDDITLMVVIRGLPR